MKRDRERKLNLACGLKSEKGYINTDIYKLRGVDINFDLNKYPYPFKNNEFEEIKILDSIHVIENLFKFMEEIWRIAKPNAILKIKSEVFLSPECANDPFYKTRIGYNTFNVFLGRGGLEDYYSPKARFEIIKRRWIFSENKYLKWLSFIPNIFPRLYSRFFYFYFPSNKLYFELKVKKI